MISRAMEATVPSGKQINECQGLGGNVLGKATPCASPTAVVSFRAFSASARGGSERSTPAVRGDRIYAADGCDEDKFRHMATRMSSGTSTFTPARSNAWRSSSTLTRLTVQSTEGYVRLDRYMPYMPGRSDEAGNLAQSTKYMLLPSKVDSCWGLHTVFVE
jgi:hypothetical protein